MVVIVVVVVVVAMVGSGSGNGDSGGVKGTVMPWMTIIILIQVPRMSLC